MIKNETLNIFTYDYPLIGNDSHFIKDEIKFLSNKFKKINIIPIKKGLNNHNYTQNNIDINYGLINEIFNIQKVLFKITKVLICKFFWKEIISLKKKISVEK